MQIQLVTLLLILGLQSASRERPVIFVCEHGRA